MPTPIQSPRQTAATSASWYHGESASTTMPMSLIPNAAKQTMTRCRAGCHVAQTSEPTTMPAAIGAEDRAVRADAAVVVRLHDARQERGERRHRDHQDHGRGRDPGPDPRLAQARSGSPRRARAAGRAPGRARTRAGARARAPPPRRRTTQPRSPRRPTGRTCGRAPRRCRGRRSRRRCRATPSHEFADGSIGCSTTSGTMPRERRLEEAVARARTASRARGSPVRLTWPVTSSPKNAAITHGAGEVGADHQQPPRVAVGEHAAPEQCHEHRRATRARARTRASSPCRSGR